MGLWGQTTAPVPNYDGEEGVMETVEKSECMTKTMKPVEDIKASPVPDEKVWENVRLSKDINAPLFSHKPDREGAAIYVGAGPTMPGFLEEIRAKKNEGQFIITSNMTYDWLVDRGIVADAVLIIDPKDRIAGYINKPQKETKFYVGTVCVPGVANGLLEKGADVEKLLVAYGTADEADIELQREIYGEDKKDFLTGGTMTGLRVMNFVLMLGFKAIELYGLDSCYPSMNPRTIMEGEPGYDEAIKSNAGAYYVDGATKKKFAIADDAEGGFFYAYKKKHHGSLEVVRCPDGRTFLSSPVFAHQAKQFVKWYDRFEGKLKITVHGDNLTSHALKCHLADIERRKSTIGDKKFTDGYKPIFLDFFKTHQDHVKMSDYTRTCVSNGVLALRESLGRELSVFNYDFVMFNDKEWADEKYDVVHSLNLMEHIELECVDNVLKDIQKKTKYMAIFHIGLGDSDELLSNNKDAHVTAKAGKWWLDKLGAYFTVTEGKWLGGVDGVFICQSFDAQENFEGEGVKLETNDITKHIDAVTKISDERMRNGGIQQPPKSVKIEITSRCNLRCKYCALRTRADKVGKDMDFFLFQKITEDMRLSGVEEIGLFYLGESFCAPELLVKCAKWCKQTLQFPYIFLTANASLARADTVKELMEAGLDSLKWSVNAGSPEEFTNVTGGTEAQFRNALANIKAAHGIRKEGNFKTALSASSILYEKAYREKMKPFIDENVKPYVDRHYWLPLYQMSMYSKEIKEQLGYDPMHGNCARLDESTMEPTRRPLPCWCAITEGHVRVDGGLSACGFGSDSRFDMGVLDGTNFMRCWNSPKFVKLREAQFRTLVDGPEALKGTVCAVCVAYSKP